MPFECLQCGECCAYLGQVHTIEEERGDLGFLLCNQYSGEETEVRVDSDKRHLYERREIFGKWPEACPFLRADPENDRICCIIHETRPSICRDFGCWRILILGADGKWAGRVIGNRNFLFHDDCVKEIWEEEIKEVRGVSGEKWDDMVARIFEGHGYSVRR